MPKSITCGSIFLWYFFLEEVVVDLLCRLFICLSCCCVAAVAEFRFPHIFHQSLTTFDIGSQQIFFTKRRKKASDLTICLYTPPSLDFVGTVDKNYPSALCRCPTGPVIESDTFIACFSSNKCTCLSNTANIHPFLFLFCFNLFYELWNISISDSDSDFSTTHHEATTTTCNNLVTRILEGAMAKVKELISNKLEVFQYLISPCIPNQLEPMSKFLKVEDASIFRSETLCWGILGSVSWISSFKNLILYPNTFR